MDTRTGEIYNQLEQEQLAQAFIKQMSNTESNIIPIKRELTLKERNEKQILLYSPCGCGSEKKFKFCCHKKIL